MENILYIYDVKSLKTLENKLSSFKFFSIAYFIHKYDTVESLEDLDIRNMDNSIIDITNIVRDGNFYKVFVERYLLMVSEKIGNVNFCLQKNYFESFNEQFPYVFDEEKINFEFCNDGNVADQDVKELKISVPVDLFIYKNIDFAKKLNQKEKLISVTELIENYNGIAFLYNTDNITYKIKNKIEYIDISAAIRLLKLRQDLMLQFDVLFQLILKIKDIKYCIESSLSSEAIEFFPFIFSGKMFTNDFSDKDEVKENLLGEFNIEKLKIKADKISEVLIGHDRFKNDFKKNLLKLVYLNRMGESKILSVLLSGHSGIGKTEFAKIVSNTMFPEEPLIKINFGNYSTEGVLNSLIGSPLGYIGSEDGGELINKISTSKSKIILIDEFEKATPSVFNFFYELLEDARFTDRHGVEHNLSGYIIIFTSNMLPSQYKKQIPTSLQSRFDMVYYFEDLSIEEKKEYIFKSANYLIGKVGNEFNMKIRVETIHLKLDELVKYNNLRDIQRKIEDIMFNEFLESKK